MTVLFFASFKEAIGQERLTLEVPCNTLAELRDYLEGQYGVQLRRGIVVHNQQVANNLQQPLSAGDEVAFLPPVSGGNHPSVSGGSGESDQHLALVSEPIVLQPLLDWAILPSCGAVCSFVGTTRTPNLGLEVLYLDYSAYSEMALEVLGAMVQQLRQQWPSVGRVAIVHRLGVVAPAEASVAVVVSAQHRQVSFQACEWALETLKQRLPVWKKEHTSTGSTWVAGKESIDNLSQDPAGNP